MQPKNSGSKSTPPNTGSSVQRPKMDNVDHMSARELIDMDPTAKWPNAIVYSVYRNDDLESLPVAILEQMERHISGIAMKKRKEELERTRAECTHHYPNGSSAFEFRGMQWNGYEQCSICSAVKS